MAAVAGLDDIAARTGITVLRGTGMRIGELMDLEPELPVGHSPATAPGCKVPLGKLDTERSSPSTTTPSPPSTTGWPSAARQRALPHPRDRRPADFLFIHRRSPDRAACESAAGSTPPSRQPVSPDPTAHHCGSPPTSCGTPTPPPGQRRHEPASADGPARPRHPRDDPALRLPGQHHRPRRLRRRDGHDARQRRDLPLVVAGRPAPSRPHRMAPLRDAQNPGRPRLLLPAPRRRSLPLRQHLRTMRQLRHQP